MPITRPLHGSCYCRRNTYTIKPLPSHPPSHKGGDNPPHIYYCHCPDCRKLQACLVVAWINTPVSSFTLQHHPQHPSESVDEIYKLLKSSPGVERRFCGFCGTHLTYQATKGMEMGWIDVTFGSLDEEDMQGLGEGGKGGEEEEKAENAAMEKEGHTYWGSRIRWWVKQVTEVGFAKNMGLTA